MKFLFIFMLVLALCWPALAKEESDLDKDGLLDYDEINIYQTNPDKADTDSDGYIDGLEIAHGYSPLAVGKKSMKEIDSDSDGLSDATEIALRTDLMENDTDFDGISDGDEVNKGMNPHKGGGDKNVKRSAKVDLTNQHLYYYMNDVEVGSFPVSSGRINTPTPLGEFEIIRKLPVVRYAGIDYDYPNTKWNLEFKRSYYLHGAYWHNQFGKRPMSHGCVNIGYKDAEKLYAFLHVGDNVSVVGKTPVSVAKK